ncbi:uncharacterized protein atf7ip2 isoform X2 [Entelurus aequoreus]|uniref:uncharacterized protein atf7ip2 isoform X2 n=1 Tax=Entelurus aequoreus TaxID=161455 RepID=UPI002B1D5AAC|nr:uncharacterized protein atf7ip2 isoform X2 [Entelurus aequoreus]
MKRLLPESDYPENGKRRFSKSELEAVMEREIQKAVHSNNSRLQILTETIQQLQHEIDYGSTMQKLEARIETIKRRAKAALAAAETKKKRSVKDSEIINIDSDDNSMPETIDKRKKKTNYLIEIMESTTSSLKRIQAGNTVMSALENLCKAASPPPQRQMPEEHPSQPNISGVQQAPAQQDEPPYPPLPLNAFPSVLNMEAASYNIPEKVKVHLALIKHPATLSVMWNLDEEDASPPPMESYRSALPRTSSFLGRRKDHDTKMVCLQNAEFVCQFLCADSLPPAERGTVKVRSQTNTRYLTGRNREERQHLANDDEND